VAKFKPPTTLAGYPCSRCEKQRRLCYQHRAHSARLKKARRRNNGSPPTPQHEIRAEEQRRNQQRVLDAYRRLGNVTAACAQASVGRRTHHQWMQRDPLYAVDFGEAREEAVDRLEAEARRRAFGVTRTLYHAGREITNEQGQPATIREYSDTLLIFLLKGAKPEKYRERYDHTTGGRNLTAPAGAVDVTKLSTETLRRIVKETGVEEDQEVTDG
jgi:hypothetical protein